MMGNEAAALVSAALAARKNAYVPYSGYPVGAAVLGEDGNVSVSYTHLTLPTNSRV